MAETTEFNVGDSVVAVAGARGTIVDTRDMTNGDTVYGVVDINGVVRYYTASALSRPI